MSELYFDQQLPVTAQCPYRSLKGTVVLSNLNDNIFMSNCRILVCIQCMKYYVIGFTFFLALFQVLR